MRNCWKKRNDFFPFCQHICLGWRLVCMGQRWDSDTSRSLKSMTLYVKVKQTVTLHHSVTPRLRAGNNTHVCVSYTSNLPNTIGMDGSWQWYTILLEEKLQHCLRNSTTLLEEHYSIAGGTLKHCWRKITTLPQGNYNIAAGILQHCCRDITTLLEGHYNLAGDTLQRCWKDITTLLQAQTVWQWQP